MSRDDAATRGSSELGCAPSFGCLGMNTIVHICLTYRRAPKPAKAPVKRPIETVQTKKTASAECRCRRTIRVRGTTARFFWRRKNRREVLLAVDLDFDPTILRA